MTLKKQVNVLPSGVKILVKSDETVMFNGTVDDLRRSGRDDNDLLFSSYVKSIVPLGFFSLKIAVKQRKENIKEGNSNE